MDAKRDAGVELHTKKVLESAGWIFQLISGLILALLVTFHFFETHLVSHSAMDYENVVARLTDIPHKVMYAVLLLSVSFHAFNGLRAILLDTNFGAENTRSVNIILFFAVFVAFAYGLLLLIEF
jgi:succinate dehydrogenase / fumarate reductase membrane anchor subunit